MDKRGKKRERIDKRDSEKEGVMMNKKDMRLNEKGEHDQFLNGKKMTVRIS